jgi:hypothetical protein
MMITKLCEKEYDGERDVHKELWELDIPMASYVGPRGGEKHPQHIEWCTRGSGLFTSVWSGCGCAVLSPHVRYVDGRGRSRRMHVRRWVLLTGHGTATRMPTDSDAYMKLSEQIKACDEKKTRWGERLADIVTSIANRGGRVTITSRR